MVYKKYIRKNGKLHGPYYYESYREDGVVKKRYLGNSLPMEDGNKKLVVLQIFLVILAVALVLGFIYYPSTGKVIDDSNQSASAIQTAGSQGNVVVPLDTPTAANPDISAPLNENSQQSGQVVDQNVGNETSSGGIVVQVNETLVNQDLVNQTNNNESVNPANVSIDNESIINETLGNETAINATFTNASNALVTNQTNLTFVNITFANETISNETNVSLNLTIKISRARIKLGQPVRWVKNVSLDNPGNVTIELPKEADNISVTKVEKGQDKEANAVITGNVIIGIEVKRESRISRFLKSISSLFTGRAIDNPISDNTSINVTLNDSATNYVIEYETPAPTAIEQNTSNGKEVIISAPTELNYTDVLSYTEIPEIYSIGQESKIKVYWKENESYVPFDAYDNDGNGKLDYIEWITPHLSNQTFEIILINKAEHLDENRTYLEEVYPLVKDRDYNYSLIPNGHYLRVTFEQNLTNEKDITIYAKANNASISVYEKDGTDLIAKFDNVSEDGIYKVYLTNLSGIQGTFDLLSIGDVSYDYVVDPVFGTGEINFTSPTPSNGVITANKSVPVNVSVSTPGTNLVNVTFNWNGTNYNLYDNSSLLLMMNLDNNSAIGDNATYAVDVSKYGNNGTIVNGPIWTNSGKYGGAVSFNGVNQYINTTNFGTFNYNNAWSVSAWINMNNTAAKTIVSKSDLTSVSGWYFGVYNVLDTALCNSAACDYSNTIRRGGTTPISDNRWHYVVMTYDGSGVVTGIKYYIDGAEETAYTNDASGDISGGISNTKSVMIGARLASGSPGVYFNGTIDEVRIWNRVLTAGEVQERYFANLQKFNSTQWYLNVNQSKNSTAGLDIGTYTYQAFAADSSGNSNSTEQRTVVIQSSLVPVGANFTAPTLINGTTTANTSIPVNVSISSSNLTNVTFNWNGANYAVYDSSLVLRMNLDNNTVIGENDTYAVDSSIFSSNGTLVNGAAWTANGKYGLATQFDGINDYVDLGDPVSGSLDFGTATNFTISVWINRAKSGTLHDIFDKRTSAIGNAGYLLGIHSDNKVHIYIADSTGQSGEVTGTSTITNNRWYYITGVFVRGVNGTIYINGNLDSQSSISSASGDISNNAKAVIGYHDPALSSSWTYFNGTIDEVRIWNRALTASEVNQLYMTNLQKYNSTQWYLYVNQSKSSTAGLDVGVYTYQAFATDGSGNLNSTEQRTIIISSGVDSTSPVVNLALPANSSSVSANLTYFAANFSDNIQLANATLYLWNSTGSNILTNFTVIKGTVNSTNLSLTLPYTGNFSWNYIAYDNSSNSAWNSTNYTLTYTDTSPISACPSTISSAGSYYLTQNLVTTGTCLTIMTSNVAIDGHGFSITGDGGVADYGIKDASGPSNINITNINITHFYSGIYLNGVNNAIIRDSIISSSTDAGILFWTVTSSEIINTSIRSSAATGLSLAVSSTSNRVINSTISYNTGEGIAFAQDSNSNQVINSNISSNTNSGIRFYLNVIDNLLLNNNIINNTNYAIFSLTAANRLVYNNTFGQIIWSNSSFLQNLTTKGDITFPGEINILNNSVSVNVTGFTIGNINSSANITLYGLSTTMTNPKIYRDGINICNETTIPSCTNFTSLNAGTVSFNVSSWSNYTILDVGVGGCTISGGLISCCGNITSFGVYNLTQNLQSNGTCLSVTANNVDIDGKGFSITGDGGASDYGIDATNATGPGWSNLTLRNGNVSNFGVDVAAWGSVVGGTGFNGGSVKLVNLTLGLISSYGGAGTTVGNGGGVTATNSSISKIISYGGFNGGAGGQGGGGGNVTLIGSNITNITSYGGSCLVSDPFFGTVGGSGGSVSASNGNVMNAFFDIRGGTGCTYGGGTGAASFSSTGVLNLTGVKFALGASVYGASSLTLNYSQYLIDTGLAVFSQQMLYTTIINSSSGEIYFDGFTNYPNGVDGRLASNISISHNFVSVDSSFPVLCDPGLCPVNVTLYNITTIGMASPRVFMGNQVCSNCSNASSLDGLSGATVKFSIPSTTGWGNYSIQDAPVPDTTNPLITINVPVNKTYNALDLINGLRFNVTTDESMSLVQFSLDSGLHNLTMTNMSLLEFNYTNTTIADGTYAFRVYSNDTSGNRNDTESKVFSVDQTYPNITLYSPLNTTYTSNNITINFTSSDNNAIDSRWWYNGTANLSYAGATSVILGDGSHSLVFYTNDSAGNVNSTLITFLVDTAPPRVTINSPTGTYTTATAAINITLNEAGYCFYNINNGTNTTLTNSGNIDFSGTTASLSNGDYTFYAYCNDTAGNRNDTEIKGFTTNVNNGGGGGGGGGGTTCTSTGFNCGNWGECINGLETKTCVDNCGNSKAETWSCQIINQTCTSNWQCGNWNQCVNSVSTRSCIDLAGCESSRNENKDCNKIDCTPSVDCGGWGQCVYNDKVENVFEGKISYTGIKERTCVDTTKCIGSYTDELSCTSDVKVKLVEENICGENVLKAINSETNQSIADINLDAWKQSGKFSLNFVQNNDISCPHCSNGVKDIDEQGVDCGGKDCKVCLVNNEIVRTPSKNLKWIFWIIAYVLLLLLFFLIPKKENNVSRIRKLIKEGLEALHRGHVAVAVANYYRIKLLYADLGEKDKTKVRDEIMHYYNLVKSKV